MGNSASKTTRTLGKTLQHGNQALKSDNQPLINNLKKQVTTDHLKGSSESTFETNGKKQPQVFTERPPKELEQMGDSDATTSKVEGNKLFEEAVNAGLVQVKDDIAKQTFNANHESIRVLKNRENVEKQYEGLFIPKDADKPDTPERFLSEEDKRNFRDPDLMKKKIRKSELNAFGLFDSNRLTDLIIDYKVIGESEFNKTAKESKVNDENINKLQKYIDEGIINLPTHKVTLHESIDPESRHVKQKLIIVKDDWVKTIKEDIEEEEKNKLNNKTTSKKDLEVFEQFKMLENLVSKSQISTKKSDGPTDTVETVMHRPKKQLVKEIKKML